MSTPDSERDAVGLSRRELLNALAASGGALAARLLLPAVWSTPVVLAHALPAHAQLSCQVPRDHIKVTPQPISSNVTSGTVKLTISVPSTAITNRTQFQVLERAPGSSEASIVGMMAPSGDSAFSSSFELELKRSAAGTYRYQLCWDNGVSDWLSVQVGAK